MDNATNSGGMPKPKAAMQLDERGVYIVKNQVDELRVAEMLLRSGAVNQTLKTSMHVVMAIQAARSLGLNPYTALRQIGFIDGSLMLYGDLELAVVRKSGKLAHKEEFLYCVGIDGKYQRRCFENANLHLPVSGAVCRMRRIDDGDHTEEAAFSVEDAKLAGLWGKTPAWRSFPSRMLQMRARGLCLRNMFSDVLQGAASEYDLHAGDTAAYGSSGEPELTGAKAALEKILRSKQAAEDAEHTEMLHRQQKKEFDDYVKRLEAEVPGSSRDENLYDNWVRGIEKVGASKKTEET